MSTNRIDPTVASDSATVEHYWHVPRLLIAWVVTAIAATLVVSLCTWSSGRAEWLTVVIAGGTLLTFALQLGTAQRQGFIARTALSVGGAVLIVAAIAGISFIFGF
jgi:hypothetical protein